MRVVLTNIWNAIRASEMNIKYLETYERRCTCMLESSFAFHLWRSKNLANKKRNFPCGGFNICLMEKNLVFRKWNVRRSSKFFLEDRHFLRKFFSCAKCSRFCNHIMRSNYRPPFRRSTWKCTSFDSRTKVARSNLTAVKN